MTARSKPFIVMRNKCIAPKERRVEPIPSGYSVRELHNDSEGRYWYVVTSLELMPTSADWTLDGQRRKDEIARTLNGH